jgi:hypothetical protein
MAVRLFSAFIDADGEPVTTRLSLNQVGAPAMTLPELINKALRSRFNDQSLRCAYPQRPWHGLTPLAVASAIRTSIRSAGARSMSEPGTTWPRGSLGGSFVALS